MGKDPKFTKFILDECIKQKNGDYNVYFSTIIEKYKTENSDFANSLLSLRLNIKSLNGGAEPILFYPRAETIENSFNARKNTKMSSEPFIIGIYDDELSPSYTAPGYIIQNDGTSLQYYNEITEDFAW